MENSEKLTPAENDAALVAWLEQSCAISIREAPIPNTLGKHTVAQALKPRPKLAEAKARVTASLHPAQRSTLAPALMRCLHLCGKFKAEGDDALGEREYEAFLAELMRYPGDVAIYALEQWPRNNAFWPHSWKPLQDECEKLFGFRRRLLPALMALRPYEPPKDERTPEEQEADRADVRRMCDDFLSKMGARAHQEKQPHQGKGSSAMTAALEARRKRDLEEAESLCALEKAEQARIDAQQRADDEARAGPRKEHFL